MRVFQKGAVAINYRGWRSQAIKNLGSSHCIILCLLFAAITVIGDAWRAFADVQVLTITSGWRYNQTANLDGTNWWATNFDDSSWTFGNGLLYVESNPLVSPLTTPLSLGRTTYYFRAHFLLPIAPTNLAIITFSTRIDDGAVFYLNGHEIQRVRMPAAPTQIFYTNFATATPPGGDATFSESFAISGTSLTNFVQGDNLLAVEVHQNSTQSDDIVFGTSVFIRLTNGPPFFISHPTNVTVIDGRPSTLGAIVDGNPTPVRQWFKDGVAIAGATNLSITFPNTNPTNAGSYQLLASNAFGAAFSSNAVLTVVADTHAPYVISALADRNLTNILISFSETVAASSIAAVTNYSIFQKSVPSNILTIQAVTFQNGTNVLLTTSRRVDGVNYSLQVSGARDISSVSNAMLPHSLVPLTYSADLVGFDATSLWRYYQLGQQPATNWFAPDYDDSAWPEGASLFAAGPTTPSTVEQVGTALILSNNATPVITYYFRTMFNLPGPLQAGSVRLREVVDDSAAFYLNGSEIFSIGVPAVRPLAYTNIASRSIGTAAYEPVLSSAGFSLSKTNLNITKNVLAAEVHQTSTGVVDVAFGARLEAVVNGFDPRPTLVLPPLLLEGVGTLTNQGQLFLREPSETNIIIQLTTGGAADLVLPNTVTIPAGATNAIFDLRVPDDAVINGPRTINVQAGPVGVYTTASRIIILDNETNYLSLVLPLSLIEGQFNAVGQVRFAQPAARDVPVALTSDDPSELIVPPFVTVAAGETSATFNLAVVDDHLIDGPQWVGVTGSVLGWPPASTNVIVNDNESLNLKVTLPPSLVEGAAVGLSTGTVSLSAITVSDVVIALSANPASQVTLPPSVTILGGQSKVTFALSANENDLPDGTRSATITASAPAFTNGSATIAILDNDAHHFRFSNIPSPQDTSVAFGVTIQAVDINGALVANFNRSVPLAALGLGGDLPIEPATSGQFSAGQWTGSLRVTAPGRLVQLSSPLAPGESNPFQVEPQAIKIVSQLVSDIAWHQASGTLFATVPPTGGTYANRIVAIDPVAGAVTASYPIGDDPGQMEISSSGAFLYVTLSNRNAFCRFDLTTRQAGVRFGTGSGPVGARWIRDFAIIGGTSDSIVATFSDGAGNSAGTWRYNSGAAVGLNTFSALDPYTLEASPQNQTIYGYQNNNAFPLMRGLAVVGSSVAVTNGLFTAGAAVGGGNFVYRYGVLYNNFGRAVAADSFALLGDYPGVLDSIIDVALPEVDPVLNRTIYFSGRFNFNYKLKAYDRDSFLPVGEYPLPHPAGAGRLLLCGTNGLAFNSGDQVWFVRAGTIQPTQTPANLVLAQTAAQLPGVLGSNLTCTFAISNSGPGLATFIRLSDALPPGATVISVTASTGTVVQASDCLAWNVTRLDPGASEAMQVLLRPAAAGWMTNAAFVNGYESDPDFKNNISNLALFAQLPPEVEGVFEVRVSSEDMIYDPMRDRLLVSVGNGTGSQSRGIAVLNPHTGVIERFVSLNSQPSKLVRSLDGKYLYVSLKEAALVRRLILTNLLQDLSIQLGSELIYGTPYPFFAGDMEVLPDNSRSIAVWRVRREGPLAGEFGRGIAIFDDGVMRSNIIAVYGGSFTLQFDTDQHTLYAFQGGPNAYRCAIDANGVSLAEVYPSLNYSLGNEMEYAAGQFFNSAGRALRMQPLGVIGTYAGSEYASLVEPDAASGRVFYLARGDSGWRLNAYTMSTFDLLGSLAISNVMGSPSSLIRWGTNGLAFRTTSNQLFIIRTPLVDSSTGADLGVSIEGPDSPVSLGNTALFVLTVTNQGPAAAREVRLINSFSPGLEVVWSAATAGQSVTNGFGVVWTIPELSAGAEELLAVVVRPALTGTYTVSADVVSAVADAYTANNSAKRILFTGESSGPESVRSLRLPVNDVAWSPSRAKLLVTVNSDEPNWAGVLASVDPITLEMIAERRLGPNAGRLAISDDDSRLYAALDYDLMCLDVSTLSLRQRFPLDSSGALVRAGDLESLHGSPDSVVVGRQGPAFNTADLAVFDNGLVRSNMAALPTRAFIIEQGNLSSPVFVEDFFVNGFRRYTVDVNGTSLLDVDTSLLPQLTSMDLKWADGVLFSSIGLVVDPFTLTLVGTVSGITNDSLVCYDPLAQRAYYLSPSGTNMVIRAVDRTTLMTTGTKTICSVSGVPASLVRWGRDGLAFRTSGEQLFVIRTGLIPSAPSADLALSLVASSPLAYVGSNFVYSLEVTNAGPNVATNCQVFIRLSPNAGSFNVSASQGTTSGSNQPVVASLGMVPVGAVAMVNVSVLPSQPGDLTILAKIIADSTDPSMTNNSRSATNSIVQRVSVDSVVTLNQPAADLAYNPALGRIYASGGSQIAVVNPVLSQNETYWQLPGPTRRLALSDDGQLLYVGQQNGVHLWRVATASGQTDLDVSLQAPIDDVEPLPGSPDSFVASAGSTISVYDNAVMRPAYMVDSSGAKYLEFSLTPNLVYANGFALSGGRRFRTLAITSDGIGEIAANERVPFALGDLEAGGNLLFATGGEIIDPTSATVISTFSGLGAGSVVEPDPVNRRVFFLTEVGTNWQVRTYHSVTFGFIGSISISNLLGQATSLIRWGDDGLAFGTTSNQLFLLRTSLTSIVADTDHDGLPDDWEIVYGLDPANPADASIDSDSDGLTNLQEYLAGTNPRDARSLLRISSMILETGVLRVSFPSAAGKFYAIEESPSFPATLWSTAISGLEGSGGALTVTLSNTPPAGTRFIRLRAGQR